MVDEFFKTLILAVPNFVGFVAGMYILVRFVIEPNQRLIEHLIDLIVQLEVSLEDCRGDGEPPVVP